jgi:threonine dehydrogenase-like Zn-dependent dehydrogenase
MTGDWSRVSLIGELNSFTFYPSPDLLHKNSTIYGSWVTSTWRMEELAKKMNHYGFTFDSIITHTFNSSEIDLAYSTANEGSSGKIVVEFL